MSIRNDILESLSEGMLSSIDKGSKGLSNFQGFIKGIVPKGTTTLCGGIDFNIPTSHKSTLSKKLKSKYSYWKTNVYKVDKNTILVEYEHLLLPVCLIVDIDTDTFDVACSNLQKAFSSSVGNARDLIDSIGYRVIGLTYNTVGGKGTFCINKEEVIESFISAYCKAESERNLRMYLIDSGLYKYTTFSSIYFKSLMVGSTSDLHLDVLFDIQDMDGVRGVVSTFSSPMNMYMSIKDNSLLITMVLKG